MRQRAAATWYLTGSGIQRGASLVALLVLAHQLSIGDFGVVVLLGAGFPLMSAAAGLGLDIPLTRAVAAGQQVLADELVRSLRFIAFAASLLVSTGVGVLLGVWPEILAAAVGAELVSSLLAGGALLPLVTRARAAGDARSAAAQGALISLLPLAGRVGAVLVFPTVLAYSLGGLLAHVVLVALLRVSPKREGSRRALSLGLPFLPHVVGHWGMALSDRLLVGGLLGTAAVARYGPSYQLAALLGLVFTEVNRAPIPLWGNPTTADATLRRGAVHFLFVQVAAAAVFAALLPLLSRVLLPDQLQLRLALLLILVLGQACLGIYLVAANALTLRLGDRRIGLLTLGCAGLNVLLNLVLLPVLGLAGACLATTLGYAALAAAVLVRSSLITNRSVPLPLPLMVAMLIGASSASIVLAVV